MKKLLLYSLVVLFGLTGLSSCRESGKDEIVIAIPDGPSVISMMQLVDQPPVVDGKKVKLLVKPEPLQIQAMMVQKEIDFAILPTVMAANLYNKGVDYRLLAIPVWGTLYVVTNDSSVHDTSDLHDRTIHIFGQGATADVLFRYYSTSKELKNLHIDYSFSSNQDVAMALLNSTARTAIVSEPLVSMLLSRDKRIRIISELTIESGEHNLKNDMFTQTSLLVNADFAAGHPEMTRKIMAHIEASCMLTRLRPEKVARMLYEHHYTDDIGTAMRSIPLCNINFVSAPEIQEEIYSFLNLFYTFDPTSLGGKLPDKNFILHED